MALSLRSLFRRVKRPYVWLAVGLPVLFLAAGSGRQHAADRNLLRLWQHADNQDGLQRPVSQDQVLAALKRGANVNARYPDGTPVLVAAAWSANPDCVKVLVDRGADVEATDHVGDDAILAAVNRDDVESLRILVPRMPPSWWSNKLGASNALIAAGELDSFQCLKYLVDAGAPVNLPDFTHDSPLMCACMSGSDCAFYLMDHGANVNARDDDGKTPLMDAVSGYYALAPYHGPPKRAHGRLTALTLASIRTNDRTDLLDALIDRGALVNAKDSSGMTAMDYADSICAIPYERFLKSKGGMYGYPKAASPSRCGQGG